MASHSEDTLLLQKLNLFAYRGWVDSLEQWENIIRGQTRVGSVPFHSMFDHVCRTLSVLESVGIPFPQRAENPDDLLQDANDFLKQIGSEKTHLPILLHVSKYGQAYTLFFDENAALREVASAAAEFMDGDDVYCVFSVASKPRAGFMVLDVDHELIEG